MLDILAWFPFELALRYLFGEDSITGEVFELFYILKILRIQMLNNYLSYRFLINIVKRVIKYKQDKYINDPRYNQDMVNDRINISEKIYAQTIAKLIRLICQIAFVAFFIGNYWYLFCQTVRTFAAQDDSIDYTNDETYHNSYEESLEKMDSTFIYYKDSWDLRIKKHDENNLHRSLTAMYFAFTTLSTVGFGDYYPVSDTERLTGAFVLLFGVATFSYF